MRTAALLLAALLPAAACADEQLWEKLKTEPNMVVVMRHADATWGNPLAWDESGGCRGERMLSKEGREHAKKIGEAFAARGIKPVVISSPMCRCRDTARLAFGAEPLTDPDLREAGTADAARAAAFEAKAQALIAGKRGPTPVVLVNHRPNINLLTFELLDEGEMVVGRANEKGVIDVLGRISVRP